MTLGSVRSKDLNLPLKAIQASVVEALPVGKAKVSRNGRTFHSHYFRPDGTDFKKAENVGTRFRASVTIFGDRRPYYFEVSVRREQAIGLRGGTLKFRDKGSEPDLARFVMRKIEERLAERRKDRNLIDDFRVF
jgi:hypothetical protein